MDAGARFFFTKIKWVGDGQTFETHPYTPTSIPRSTRAADKGYRINDGEGLMHEDHVNSSVLDSVVEGNKGNTHIGERDSIEKRFRRYVEYAIKPGGTYDADLYNNDRDYARYDGEAGSGIDDRILLRIGDEVDRPLTLEGGVERFTFADFAFIRVASDRAVARGDLRAVTLKVGAAKPTLSVNGKKVATRVADNILTWRD